MRPTTCAVQSCGGTLAARLRNLSDGPLYMATKIIDAHSIEQFENAYEQIDRLWCPHCGLVYVHEKEMFLG